MNKRTRSDFVSRGDGFDSFFKVAVALWCVGAAISLAVLGFVIWVVILLLEHFGVLAG